MYVRVFTENPYPIDGQQIIIAANKKIQKNYCRPIRNVLDYYFENCQSVK